ncbi:unnamed protein product [Heligmosomoides polygyrus]|uniref:CCHC-type domain-containing protein n=1 Tax=Heligmosomoides polygyrus TaxID=6339 RepID=A0A183G4Y6_HELPZ|nr:unnamed protein product [Heligmosomoides polygyrus]
MDNNEFERLQRNYNLLRNAIPPLPSPEELNANIIRQLLEVTIDKTKLELTLIRMHLSTPWTIPGILFALYVTTPEVSEAMMNRPQFDDEDRPLLIDYSQINAAVSDQLELLCQHQDNIKQIRNNLLLENQKEEKSFRDRVMQEFKVLENLMTTMERNPVVLNWEAFDMDFSARIAVFHNRGPEGVNAGPDLGDTSSGGRGNEDELKIDARFYWLGPANVHNAVRDVDADDADADDVGADADIDHRELDAGLPYADIEDDVEVREAEETHANEDFIEPIDELDVGGIGPEDVIVAVEDIYENADMAGPMDQPDHDEIRPEEVLVVADEVDGDQDQHDAARRRQGIVDQGPDDRDVIEELFLRQRRAIQERDDLQMMINELESQERCAPRRYREGMIRRRAEFGMPCVFCEALGHHYSDSCLEVMDAQERKRILRETGRCKQCLDRGCEGGDDCRKKDARCRYCSKKGHNPAICSLPERSRDIEDQLEVLQRNHEDASNRVLRIRRRLRRHGVDI